MLNAACSDSYFVPQLLLFPPGSPVADERASIPADKPVPVNRLLKEVERFVKFRATNLPFRAFGGSAAQDVYGPRKSMGLR